jgi:hypothetical protein
MAQPRYTTHSGMVDILPDDVRKWQFLENLIHEEARKFNFEEIRTPIMEQTELIVRGLGQLTDIVPKRFSLSAAAMTITYSGRSLLRLWFVRMLRTTLISAEVRKNCTTSGRCFVPSGPRKDVSGSSTSLG